MPELVPTAIATPLLASRAKDALRMEEKNMPAGLIFDASSIVRTPGGYMDMVTGDQMSVDDMTRLQQAIKQKGASPALSDYINLPELYSAVPGISSTTVEDNTKGLKDIEALAAYEHGYNNIALRGDLMHNKHVAAIIPHELQHALDYKAINNEPMAKEYEAGMSGNVDPLTSPAERRAYLVEAADRLQNPSLARQAIFDVVSKGLPANASKAEDALLKAAATREFLNARPARKASK